MKTANGIPDGVDADLWNTDYVDEDHLAAFAQALELNDTQPTEGDISPHALKSPPLSTADANAPEWTRGGVEKLTATSDFAPIHQRVKKRRGRAAETQSMGLTYQLIRWPLLGFFFFIITFEFGVYFFIRQVVNLFEWLLAWRGHKRVLRMRMRNAKTYQDWVIAARELDDYLGFDDWKEEDQDSYFDAVLVRRVRSTLSRLRAAKDTRGVMDALSICVRPNFAGTESSRMYKETFYGTKRIVESHIREVVASLDYVRAATDVTPEEKRTFFRAINKNYGSSALCLSGGASFGYYHFGIIKSFLEADLLPRVITGTSAGGLIAAFVCTHTNDELKQLIRPELADKITACEDPIPVYVKRWWKTGARFSALDWARKSMYFTRGSLTFKEAYELTGRALNVSVVPADRHSPTILLNYLTAPNCVIWSAIIASAAVPGILNPVVLMAKDRQGNLKPHNLGGSRFKDGSLREDIPLSSLHTQFNCNFPIVSQTNPHVHLFFFSARGSVGRPVAHRKGKGWRGGFILSALESYLKLDMTKHFKVIRDLDLMPALLQSDWSGVFLQRFSGTITISPRSRLADWFHLLDDPDRKNLARMTDVGMRVTWPVLHFVHNRAKIETAILRGRAEVRAKIHRDRPTNDGIAVRPSSVVPIESDADTAIAVRRREQTEAMPAPIGTRRRKVRPSPRESNLRVEMPADDIPRSYTTTALGDTFRSVSSPLSAFASFRRNRSRSRSRSRRSISTWFRGEASSSEDSDDQVESLIERDWRLDVPDDRNDVFLDSGNVSTAPDSADEPRY